MRTWTSEQAVQAGILSGLARKAKAERYKQAIAELKARQFPVELNERVKRTELQMDRLDMLLDDSNDARELTALTQAKERLLNAWSLLTGFERPGIRRNKSKRSSYQSAQPIEPDHEPAPAMPAKPMGWEYDL